MKSKRISLPALTIAILLLKAGLAAEPAVDGPKYNFVCADFSKGEVCVVDAKGEIKQTFKSQNPNDVWALSDGGVLFAWRGGVRLYDKTGKLSFEWTSSQQKDEVHTVSTKEATM